MNKMSESVQDITSGAKKRSPLYRNTTTNSSEYTEESSSSEDEDNHGKILTTRKPVTPKTSSRQKCVTHKKMVTSKVYILVVSLVVVIIMAGVGLQWCNGDKDNINDEREEGNEHALQQKFIKLKQDFPSQNVNVWYAFLAGIKKVLADNPMGPSVFLLLHDGGDDTLTCLSKEVGFAAMTFLNASRSIPLVLEGEELRRKDSSNGYGWMIEDYGPQVEEHRTMIVYDLQKIPAVLAQSFHVMCDEISPLVKKAVYLFLMNVPGVVSSRATEVEVAEKTLSALWRKQMTRNVMDPLIVRITGNVMLIKREENLSEVC